MSMRDGCKLKITTNHKSPVSPYIVASGYYMYISVIMNEGEDANASERASSPKDGLTKASVLGASKSFLTNLMHTINFPSL